MVRRVVLGKYNDGVTFGLRISHDGYDALTAPDDPSQITFDSNWTDLVRTQVGVFDRTSNIAGSAFTIAFTDLGYKPFVEIRRRDSDTIYDDYMCGSWAVGGTDRLRSGFDATIKTNGIDIAPIQASTAAWIGAVGFYAIYKIPVSAV